MNFLCKSHKMCRAVILCAAVAAILVGSGCGSGGDSSVGKKTVRSTQLVPAIFGYSNEVHVYFTQPTSESTGLSNQLSTGEWNNSYDAMTALTVGGQRYIFGQDPRDNYWFIQRLLPTGDLGEETDNTNLSGKGWNHFYDIALSCSVGDRTFIFIHKLEYRWAILQEVLPGGKMGDQTWSATWNYSYPTMFSFEQGDRCFIGGQSNENNRVFIQEVLADGTLAPNESSNANWEHFWDVIVPYDVIVSASTGNRTVTHIFGHKQGGDQWFVQEILDGGILGSTTPNFSWQNFYPTLGVFQEPDGNSYLIGQKPGDNYTFVQRLLSVDEVNKTGNLGPEIFDDHWNFFYDFFFSFPFDPDYENAENWMAQQMPLIGDKTLKEISLPGSHDAGMYKTSICHMGKDCDTRTQTYTIGQQLSAGSRYFDLRPMTYGAFFVGHYSSGSGLAFGCLSVSLDNILADVASFASSHPQELVILKFSHYTEIQDISIYEAYAMPFDAKDFSDLQYKLTSALGDFLIKCPNGCELANMTVQELLSHGRVLLLFDDPAPTQADTGMFPLSAISLYDNYSDSNDLNTMVQDQENKLLDLANHTGVFLLSWTLTQSDWQAISCSTSLQKLGTIANTALYPQLDNLIETRKLIGQPGTPMPNIIYVDYFDTFATRMAMWINNLYYGE